MVCVAAAAADPPLLLFSLAKPALFPGKSCDRTSLGADRTPDDWNRTSYADNRTSLTQYRTLDEMVQYLIVKKNL
ncbi:hypothetical protein BB776_03610 [Planococcus salinarum]|uniref:Uncharacterized protein n=1 Tax=Planococcus salinarum TaxID=622695 RepID=A0ABX3D041_9BACL|nr:hypothetical protein BB776_03610 [Planococcus salinarum]